MPENNWLVPPYNMRALEKWICIVLDTPFGIEKYILFGFIVLLAVSCHSTTIKMTVVDGH